MRRSGLIAALMVLLVVAGLVLSAALVAWEPTVGRGSDLAFSIGVAFFTFVGAVIVWRQPGNRMGQLFAAIGLLWVTGDVAGRYSTFAHVTGHGDGFLAGLGAWYGEWYWFVFLMLTFSLMPQLFPSGKPLPGRWSTFAKVVGIFTVCVAVAAMFEEELILIGTNETIHNPIGIPGFPDIEEGPTALLVLPGGLLAIIGGVAAIVVRFRRSRGDERLQLKWFTFAVIALTVQFVAQSFFGEEDGHLYPLLDGVALALVPIAATIAILKYRLYDFDVVVNKALVYGALSAILAGSYLGIVVLLQQVFAPLTSDSDLAVAGSTLAVAALFGPLRRAVQGFIDRRFYRHRYDAQRTLEDFNARLRDDVDLEHLTADLVGVVHETVQPTHATVWLRTPEGAPT